MGLKLAGIKIINFVYNFLFTQKTFLPLIIIIIIDESMLNRGQYGNFNIGCYTDNIKIIKTEKGKT